MTATLRRTVLALALVASACGTTTPPNSAADTDTDQQTSAATPDETDAATPPPSQPPSTPAERGDGTGEGDHAADMPELVVTAEGPYDRLIEVEMVDIAFAPTDFTVTAGETIRFRFVNTGQAPHEALIASEHVQDEHEEEMMAGSNHGGDGHHGGGEMAAITLQPGEAGELDFTFTEPGQLVMGCHVPGHYGAGMAAPIIVTA